MSSSVSCPVCGADGTFAANEMIAFTLATELLARNYRTEKMMVLAVFGCLIAGIVGVIKAFKMENGSDVLLCLLGAIVAFGAVLYAYFWKR